RRQRPVFWSSLFGFFGVCFLVLLGGGHTPLALGGAVVLPGVMLLLAPPKHSLGPVMNYGFWGLVLSVLIGFVPQFYWPSSQWRIDAVETYGIDLPSILSIQPAISLEGLILILAGGAWFYLLSGFRINYAGWKWLYFWLACIMAGFALIVIFGNIYDWRYPGAEDANAFTFFPNRNQTATFIALGGIAGFCFAVLGLRGRRSIHLVGFATAALCFYALMHGRARAGLLLLIAFCVIWLLTRLSEVRISLLLKFAVPVGFLAVSLLLMSQQEAVQRIAEMVKDPFSLKEEFRLLVFKDTLSMIREAPLTGVGMGNFEAIFPQYRSASDTMFSVLHPESDLLWLFSECGLIGVLSVMAMLGGFLFACRSAHRGPSGNYRLIALLALAAFLLHSLVDVPGHRPGTLYCALFFAALALPSDSLQATRVPAYVWRLTGAFLLLIGLLWVGGSVFDWRTHSEAKSRIAEVQINDSIASKDFIRARDLVDGSLAERPLKWRFYYQRALLELADLGDRKAAASDFRRARFVEPTQGVVSYEEGFVWLDYDLGRAVSAWRDSFFRVNEHEDRNFNRMIHEGLSNPLLLDRLSMLSLTLHRFRWPFLRRLTERELLQEIKQDFEQDPSLGQFDPDERSQLIMHWSKFAEVADVGAYLNAYGNELEDSWRHRANHMKNQARFLEAVEIIRDSLAVPEIPAVEIDAYELARLQRGFAVLPSDVVKGTALLRVYMDKKDYENALFVAQSMADFQQPPAYAFYWKGEILYQMGDYIESWYAFEDYLNL
ncbi:MAG: O-antigen ligase family protein, partial [Coraliomargarita sp.]